MLQSTTVTADLIMEPRSGPTSLTASAPPSLSRISYISFMQDTIMNWIYPEANDSPSSGVDISPHHVHNELEAGTRANSALS